MYRGDINSISHAPNAEVGPVPVQFIERAFDSVSQASPGATSHRKRA